MSIRCCLKRNAGKQDYSWLARDVRDVSIFGYPPCWCSTAGEIYICSCAIAVQLLEITMDSSEKERVPSIDELCSKIPILSEYCRKLDDHVKRRYLEKITEVGVDPVTIPDEQFNSECLPPIEATDLLSYQVLETNFYTKQQFNWPKVGLQIKMLASHCCANLSTLNFNGILFCGDGNLALLLAFFSFGFI